MAARLFKGDVTYKHMSEEKVPVKCAACQALLGHRNDTDVWPEPTTDVQIQKGIIMFQCPADATYTTVEESAKVVFLHKPGAERVY